MLIFNVCIKFHNVLNLWKSCNVCPIFKKDDNLDRFNHGTLLIKFIDYRFEE